MGLAGRLLYDENLSSANHGVINGATWVLPEEGPPIEDNFPAILNEPPLDVTPNSAKLRGLLTSTGMSTTVISVYWGTTDGGHDPDAWDEDAVLGEAGEAPFAVTHEVTGLSADQTTYYRFSASNDAGRAWARSTSSLITGNVWIEKDADAHEQGLVSGAFRVHRDATVTNEALSVFYERNPGSSAEPEINYVPLSGSVTIPAGASNALIVVSPLIDPSDPNDTLLQIDLLPGGYVLDSDTGADMTIHAWDSGTTNVWLGAGDAAEPSNWSLGLPESHHDILLGIYSSADMTWNASGGDLPDTVASWTQTAAYEGVVTIETRYPGHGSFTNLTFTGNATLEGGVWTHPANTGGDNQTDRLAVSVGGDFTLGANARVNLDRRGFSGGSGPGAGNGSTRESSRTASHGGLGAMNPEGSSTYGFIARPESLGSGGRGQGGGALFLRVAGDARIDGILSADGYNRGYSGAFGSESRLNRYTHGSGGSIFVEAAAVTGSGTVRATLMSQSAYRGSGGGRIALVAANSADFSSLVLNVNPHPSPNTADPVHAGLSGAAGTLYLQSGGSRRLIIDQDEIAMSPEAHTEIPASLEVYDPPPGVGGEIEDADLVITNGALVTLTRDLRLNDLEWLCEDSTLDLSGFDLYFKADEPPGFPVELSQGGTNAVAIPAALGGGTVNPDGGRILWGNQPYTARIFAWAGPHGTLDNFDPEEEYTIGSTLTITALPDPGYVFVRWLGDVPEGQIYNPVWEMTVANRHFRAVFASDEPNTRTWMGTGAGTLAGTPENWYPEGVPQDGDHIVLEDTSYEHVSWDLDIPDLDERWIDWIYHSVDMDWNLDLESVASWTQSGYYTGKVTFNTHYPGQGSPTNLTILGDGILDGGVWTHPRNPAGDTQVNRLAVGVGGDFRLGTNAVIDLDGQGFRQASGPGAGVHGENEDGRSASHGGAGARNPATSSTYGSIFKPVDLGSGAYREPSGGGALFLAVEGDITLDGQVWARGVNPGRGVTRRAWDRLSPGAGGSILIQGRSVTGAGTLDAGQNPVTEGSVRPVFYGSGGGRIALIGRESAGFEDLTLQAYSRDDQPRDGGGRSGTIYLESPASRRIIIDQNHIGESSDNYTDIPAILNPGDTMFDDVALALKNGAFVRITMPDMRIRDLTMCTDSTLNLAGHTLCVNNLEPPADTLGTIIKDGGDIVWLKRGSLIMIR